MNKEVEKNNNKAILIGIVLIAFVFLFTLFKDDFAKKEETPISQEKEETLDYPHITAKDLLTKTKNKEDIQIIDIRSTDDYAMEHSLNSVNITSKESINFLSKEKTLIIIGYTNDDNDYSEIINFLKSKDYKKFFILTGGIDAWKNIGGNLISIGNPNSFSDVSKVIYINSDDFKEIIGNKNYPQYILDTRSKQSFDEGHLPGAENIFLDDLEKSSDSIPHGKEIFVYGDTELQGFQAGVRLYDLGFSLVKVLKGGPTEWKEKGYPIEK